MSTICEHEFEGEDPRHRGYSLVEFDLAAQLGGLSIRKNLLNGHYEIFHHETGQVGYSYSRIEDAVRTANRLEGADYIKVECGSVCPKRRR